MRIVQNIGKCNFGVKWCSLTCYQATYCLYKVSIKGANKDEIKDAYFQCKLGCLEVITNEIDVYVL